MSDSTSNVVPRPLTDYAHVLHAIADGKVIQRYFGNEVVWPTVSSTRLLKLIDAGKAGDPAEYRVKPSTIVVNGIEVPEPLRVAPANGTAYWLTQVTSIELDQFELCWDGTECEMTWLRRGLVHLSKENAIAHAKAMVAPSMLPE